jgi:outer membrane protein assembly factor BamB
MGDSMFESLKKFNGACFIVCMFLVSSILLPSVSGNIQGTESWADDLWWDNGNQLTIGSELNNGAEFTPNSDSTPRSVDARARLIDLNNWTELYGNNLNHGYTTATVPKIANSIWDRRMRDDNENPVPVYSSPVVQNNQVFIGAGNMKLYSLDKFTGAINWEVSTEDMPGTQAGGAIDSTPLVANDRVYVGCDDKYLYCFDATPDDNSDGKIDASDTDEGFNDALIAKYDLIWYFETNGSIKSSPKLSGNTVIIGCYDNHPVPARLFALDATNGNLIWNYTAPLKTKFHSTPAIENNIVYVGLEIESGSGYPSVYAFDLDGLSDGNDGWTGEARTGNKDGDIIWNFTTNSGVDSSIVIAGNKLLFGSLDPTGLVFALNKNTGAQLWNTTTGNPIYAGGAVDLANNAFYVGSDNGKLFAINLSNGNKFWSYSVGAGIKSTPIVANNKVLFGSNDNYFYALKSTTAAIPSDQRFLWNLWTDGSVDATAAAIEGIVYVGSESGYVYGFSNPDLAVEFGSLKLSERDIYEGETIDISARVFNNGSMRLSAKTNFFLHIQGSGRAVEQVLISSHDVDLAIGEDIILHFIPKQRFLYATGHW